MLNCGPEEVIPALNPKPGAGDTEGEAPGEGDTDGEWANAALGAPNVGEGEGAAPNAKAGAGPEDAENAELLPDPNAGMEGAPNGVDWEGAPNGVD